MTGVLQTSDMLTTRIGNGLCRSTEERDSIGARKGAKVGES